MNKELITKWLEKHSRDREWLAKKCNISKRTVNNWITSPISVPSKAVVIIQQLMAADQQAEAAAEQIPQNLVLEFTDSEFTDIEHKALSEGKTVRAWAKDTLNDATTLDQIITDLTRHVAEEHPPYNQDP